MISVLGKIKKIKDEVGDYVFPVTSTKAVLMEDGVTSLSENFDKVDKKIESINSQMDNISYYITPESFGYKVEDNIDINSTLQKCFNYCRDNNGGTIIIKKGRHKVNGTMRIYRNTRLILEEGVEIICQGKSPTPLVNGSSDDNSTRYNGNGNIYIEGGTWISNSVGQPESNRNLFGFAHCDGLTIKNVTFKNIKESHCIDLNSSKNVLIENCRFLGFKDSSAADRTFAEAIQIAEHTPLGFNAVGVADRTPCKDITIKSCYFGESDYYGPFGSGIGNHSSVHNVFQDNIKIESCTFNGMLFAGIRPFKWTNVSITNCTFKNCSSGIIISAVKSGSLSSQDSEGVQSNKCQSGRDYFIQGNLFEDCKKQAININGQISSENLAFIESIVISQNIIKYSDLEVNQNGAIYLQRVSNYKILNNIIENSLRGLWLKYTNNGVIASNSITKAKCEGIFINENTSSKEADDINILNGNYYSNTLIIDSNTVTDVGRSAFNIGYTSNIKISNNFIKNACYETDSTRSAIIVGSNSKNGEIFNNVVEKIELQKNKYGLEITKTCTNMECYNNDFYGKEKNLSLSQTALKEKNSLNSIKWINCELNSEITSFSSAQSPQFTKNSDGLVTVRGAVTHDKTFRGVLFTLPDGYRPKKVSFFLTVASNGDDDIPFANDVKLNRIYVNINGEVKLESSTSVSNTPFTSLDIAFYAN